ncbi:cytochrome P450 81E8-like [Syzygium oleosum]|uniref:cytochrome P450 81E8-like n=1 Tax=Syzygium oleosum TaxID=219896 RepID=UPI0024B94DEE|nr:cytochrome P450 81E8-like [Syzygium oleosum]
MEASSPYTFLSLIFFLLLTLKLFSSWLKQPKNLSPSPPSIPILGHLRLIKLPLHRTLHSLCQSYAPSSLSASATTGSSSSRQQKPPKNAVLKTISCLQPPHQLRHQAPWVEQEAERVLTNLIEEHRASSKKGGGRSMDTMVDHLLSLQETQPEYYTDEIIKGLTMVMVVGGTDTSTTTMEWAMSFLLSNPNSLKRAAEELDSVIGQECLIDETDIAKLPYLQNIVSETLRLKPPAPFLVPHMSSEDCTIGGYNVPRQNTVFINAWSIHRDPNLWDDATSFKPERFENGDDGQFKFLPFGRGRRACLGEDMAQRVIN